MKVSGRRGCPLLLAGICLFLAGCALFRAQPVSPPEGAGTAAVTFPQEYKRFPVSSGKRQLAVAARFCGEDGMPLTQGSARISAGDVSVTYPQDKDSGVRVWGLPREGEVSLVLLDDEAREVGHTTLCFSTGTLIDASTDQEGVGYVTVTEDTAAIALGFTLNGDVLECSLRLRP